MVQFCQSAKIAKSVLYNPFYSPSHTRIYIYIHIIYQISDIIYIYIERYIYSDQKILRIVFGKHTKHHKSGTHTHTDTHTSIHVHIHDRICIHQSWHASSLAGGPFLHRRVIWHGGGGHLWQHVPPTGGEDGNQRQLGADSLEGKLKGSKLAKGKRFHRFGGE